MVKMQQEISLLHKAYGGAILTNNDIAIDLNICNKFPPRANQPKLCKYYDSKSVKKLHLLKSVTFQHLLDSTFVKKKQENTKKQLKTRHFLRIWFFTCTYVMSAVEGIKLHALRLS